MSAFTDTVLRIIEEAFANFRLPAAQLRDQVQPANLSPLGNTGSGYTPADHNHTSSTDGGKLSAPVFDSYAVLEKIAAPSAPAANTARLYAKDTAGVTELFYKNSSGTERDLSGAAALADMGNATYLDFTNAAAPGTPAAGKTRIYTKADKSFYQKDDAGAETGLAGGSGATVNTGADASKGTGTSGDLYLPNDGATIYRSTGAAQIPWGPIYPFVDPNLKTWAWINQGTASVDTTRGGITLLALAAAGSSPKVRKTAAPSVPYVVTTYSIPNLMRTAFMSYGLCFRESSSGKSATLTIYSDGTLITWASQTYTTGPVFAANYVTGTLHEVPRWLRIADDNTNRIVSISYNGINFITLHSIGRTDHITADEVGFFVDSNQATYDLAMTLLHWKET
jgi:hypothetical protein